MNIIDAIKSGRKYRRKGFHSWCLPVAEKNNYHFSIEDLLADDWEVEEKAVTLTISDLSKAYDEAGDLFSRREDCRSFRDALFAVLFNNAAK